MGCEARKGADRSMGFNSHPASGAEDGTVVWSHPDMVRFQFASRLRGGRWRYSFAALSTKPVSIRIPPQGRKMDGYNSAHLTELRFNSHPASGAEDGMSTNKRHDVHVSIRIPPQGRKMAERYANGDATPVSIRIPPQGRKMGVLSFCLHACRCFNSHPASGAEDGRLRLCHGVPMEFQFASRLRGGRWDVISTAHVIHDVFQFASRLRGGRWLQTTPFLNVKVFQFASRLRGGRWTLGVSML